MVTFCIEEEKGKILSEYLETIVEKLYQKKYIDAVFMNRYWIHKNIYELYENIVPDYDGINLSLSCVVLEPTIYYVDNFSEILKLHDEIYEKTGVHVFIQCISSQVFDDIDYTHRPNMNAKRLADSTILFDKTSKLNPLRNKIIFYTMDEHFENSVVFEPELTLEKVVRSN